jgi:ribose 5-phosphate isomerase B
MRVAMGFDHAGFILRPVVVRVLERLGAEILDLGTNGPEPVDYTDYAFGVADAVSEGRAELGIACCGTGLGSQIAANKVRGVRAIAVSDTYSAKMSRLHNDANVLCLGGRVVGLGTAEEILEAWLSTPFSGEQRHCRRIASAMSREAAE